MIPVLLTIKKETLIDHTEIVLIRQIASEIVILVDTIGILTKI